MLSSRFQQLSATIALGILVFGGLGSLSRPITSEDLTVSGAQVGHVDQFKWPWETDDDDGDDNNTNANPSHGVLLRDDDDPTVTSANGDYPDFYFDERDVASTDDASKDKPSHRKPKAPKRPKKPSKKPSKKSSKNKKPDSDSEKGGLDLSDPFEDLKGAAAAANIADLAGDILPEAAELFVREDATVDEADKDKPKKKSKEKKPKKSKSNKNKTKSPKKVAPKDSDDDDDDDDSSGGLDLSNPLKDLEGVSDIGEIGKFAGLFGRSSDEEEKKKKDKEDKKAKKSAKEAKKAAKEAKKAEKLDKEILNEAPVNTAQTNVANSAANAENGGDTITGVGIGDDNNDDDD